MKKIGILTYHFSRNYGALYQAYALRNYLIDRGYKVEFVNYHPEHLESGGTLKLNDIYKKSGLKIIYLKIISLKEKLFGNKNIKNGFKNFIEEFLGVKGQEYKTISELNKANLYYDYLICGSDQVWNPSDQFGIDPVYFLDFFTTNREVKKISFAPSFGKTTLSKKHFSEVSKLVNGLDFISIREKNGINILQQLTQKDLTLVADPTVLISTYRDIIKKYETKEQDFIFCYYLRNRDNIGEISEYISNKINYQLYSPHNPHRRWKEIGETIYPCPRQWLYMLYNSKLVITNSFHGTILSILLNKTFIVPAIPGNKAEYNERVLNLLEQCDLKDRYIENFDPKNIDFLLENKINWENVNKKINNMRTDSINFLDKCFKEDSISD